MKFDYYHRLGSRLRSVYRLSDRVEAVPLLSDTSRSRLCRLSSALRGNLESGDRAMVGQGTQALADALAASFTIRTPGVKILRRRPVRSQSEYHGLYELAEDGDQAIIKVWMYTSQRCQVVAYKTFLRTFLHEFCHHLDYEWLKLPDSLHTEGFFKRESSLFKQLVVV